MLFVKIFGSLILSFVGVIIIYDIYKSQKTLNEFKKIVTMKEIEMQKIIKETKIDIENANEKIKKIKRQINDNYLDCMVDEILSEN